MKSRIQSDLFKVILLKCHYLVICLWNEVKFCLMFIYFSFYFMCVCICIDMSEWCDIIIWEPERHYQYSKMFHWEPEGHYHCTKSMAIVPFWFSTEHLWIVIVPFWLSTDNIVLTLTSMSVIVSYGKDIYFLMRNTVTSVGMKYKQHERNPWKLKSYPGQVSLIDSLAVFLSKICPSFGLPI